MFFPIPDVFPDLGSDFFPSRIRPFSFPDPPFFHPGSAFFLPGFAFFPSRIRLFSIPDLTFFHPGSDFFPCRMRFFFHLGSASKNLSILTQKNGFKALGNMIRVVHPSSRFRILTFFYPSRIQGSNGTGSGSSTLYRNFFKQHKIILFSPLNEAATVQSLKIFGLEKTCFK